MPQIPGSSNYRWVVASDEDNWISDSSDWLSESVHDESLADSSADSAATLSPSRSALRTVDPVPSVFDEPVDASDRVGIADSDEAPDAETPTVSAPLTPPVTGAATGSNRRKQRRGGRQKQNARSRRKYRRIRLFPRSVLGISMLILAAGLGAAVSGTALYMRYEFRKDLADANIKGFDKRVKLSTDAVIAEGQNAQARIQNELDPLLKQAATGDTLARVLATAKSSMMTVQTFNEAGEPVVGTAFVAASDAEKSFLVTSYNVVKAGVIRPGPEIFVRSGATEFKATLWTWQAEKDLALLIIEKGGLPKLDWAATQDVRVGSQIFALSGLGTDGGAVTSGFVADVSSSGIQHSAPLGTAFQGGPILNDRGRVVAVGSRTFSPLGFASDGVWFAPLINAACEQILKCPQGQVTGAGTQR